jgi:predicted RNA-binding protein with PUA-like domain
VTGIEAAHHWLLKTEPDVFGFADLLAAPGQTTLWEGVRNYGARNFLRAMRRGDRVLIYHSSVQPAGVVGVAEVVQERTSDPAQFDEASPYFDAKVTPDAPRWDAVGVRAVAALPRFVSLAELKAEPALDALKLLQRGNRLSVMPLTATEFGVIVHLGGLHLENLEER